MSAQATAQRVVTADGREVRFGNLLEGGDDPFCSQTVISNNPSVLRVNDDGTVSALSEGIAEITLTAVVGLETKTDSVDVIVDGTAATGINVELETLYCIVVILHVFLHP